MRLKRDEYRKLERNVDGHKYELVNMMCFDLKHKFPRTPAGTEFHPWVNLKYGISIKENFRWDGPSGPTIDTPSWMLASLIHDALYLLMKEKLLPLKYRKAADKEMLHYLKIGGMPRFRRWISYLGVRIGGGRVIKKYWKANK